MVRQEIPILFTDLRRLAETVPAFLAKKTGTHTVPSLQEEMEYALAIVGPDTELLLLEFAETFGVDISRFDFTDLLLPDGPTVLDTLLFLPIVAGLLISWLFKTVGSLLNFSFSATLLCRVRQQAAPFGLPQSRQPLLTVGDFVASAAAGRFVRHEQVYFRLAR